MNAEDLQVLAERAATVEGRPVERLHEVHARIRRARRRRQVGAVGTAVVAVALALTVGVALLGATRPDRTPPATPAPRPTVAPSVIDEEGPPVRRLTYATGHEVHWGDRLVDAGSKVWEVAPTDDGAVFIRDSRRGGCVYAVACRTLWFTDGTDSVSIGTVTGSVIRGFDVETSSVGSTVVWSEPDPSDHTAYYPRRGEFVVYDTHARREAGRFGSSGSEVLAVLDDYVYWIPGRAWCLDFQRYYGACRRYQGAMRFNVSTGTQERVSWASYRADRGSRERTLVTPFMDEGGVPEPGLSDSIAFLAHGKQLLPDNADGPAITARLATTGQVVRFRLPAGHVQRDFYPMVMWLDDDRLVISADGRGLLVCRVSSGRCREVVTGEVETGFGGHG